MTIIYIITIYLIIGFVFFFFLRIFDKQYFIFLIYHREIGDKSQFRFGLFLLRLLLWPISLIYIENYRKQFISWSLIVISFITVILIVTVFIFSPPVYNIDSLVTDNGQKDSETEISEHIQKLCNSSFSMPLTNGKMLPPYSCLFNDERTMQTWSYPNDIVGAIDLPGATKYSPEKTRTLICVKETQKEVGEYKNYSTTFHGNAYQINWEITIISVPLEKAIEKTILFGDSPPTSIVVTKGSNGIAWGEDRSGSPPINDFIPWFATTSLGKTVFPLDAISEGIYELSPSGETIVMADAFSVSLWSIKNNRRIGFIDWPSADEKPLCIAFFHDEKSLLIGTDNGNIYKWDIRNKIINIFVSDLVNAIGFISISPDDKTVASATIEESNSTNNSIYIIDTQTKVIDKIKNHTSQPSDAYFSQDNKLLFSVSGEKQEGELRVHDLIQKKQINFIKGKGFEFKEIEISPDLKYIAVYKYNRENYQSQVEIRDGSSMKVLYSIKGDFGFDILISESTYFKNENELRKNVIDFINQGFLAISNEKRIVLWDLLNHKIFRTIDKGGIISTNSISIEGTIVISYDGLIRILN